MKTIYCLFILLLLLMASPGFAIVNINGTAAQRTKIATWLTQSLGATVGTDAAGNLTIGAGGNAAATRLRNMINDAGTSVTIQVVENDATVHAGGWVSSTADPKGPTTGTQKVDVADLVNMGNVMLSYGMTPDVWLMHEITEVYEGKKSGSNYETAHVLGEAAEDEVIAANGTAYVGPRFFDDGDYRYKKIRRPDGSFVLIRRKRTPPANWYNEWFKEVVPCNTASGYIAIADPDPKVHIFNYNNVLNHTYSNAIDTAKSRPTGVAFDASLNLYTTENFLTGQDEIRVFNLNGVLVNTIINPELINPEGIDIDKVTGEIFVAVQSKVLRFNKAGNLLGSYSSSDPAFYPTDVSVWRNYPTEELFGDGTIYDIFVTDKATSQVYRFNVQNNMNTKSFVNAFGSGLLNAPEGIHIDDWWTVWVASTGNNRIYCFTPSGNPESFGNQPYFIEDVSRKIYDMAMIDAEGIYVIDETPGQGKLLLYDFKANLLKTYGIEALQCPTSLAIAFSANPGNLISIPDPGGEEKEKGFSPIVIAIVAVLFLLAVYLVYRLVTRRNRSTNG